MELSPDGLVYEFGCAEASGSTTGDLSRPTTSSSRSKRYRGVAHKPLKENVAVVETSDPGRGPHPPERRSGGDMVALVARQHAGETTRPQPIPGYCQLAVDIEALLEPRAHGYKKPS